MAIAGRARPLGHAVSRLGPAAVLDGRLGRRRQEHVDRAAPPRLQGHLRGPAGGPRDRDAPARRRRCRPRAPDRRPAGRARAGNHDRRRLPLLRDAPAQVHRRRHARPPPVHAEHGHRLLDRGPRGRAGRRSGRRRRADAPPHRHRRAPRGAEPRDRDQQDGPRRLRPGGVRPDCGRGAGVRPSPGRPT